MISSSWKKALNYCRNPLSSWWEVVRRVLVKGKDCCVIFTKLMIKSSWFCEINCLKLSSNACMFDDAMGGILIYKAKIIKTNVIGTFFLFYS